MLRPCASQEICWKTSRAMYTFTTSRKHVSRTKEPWPCLVGTVRNDCVPLNTEDDVDTPSFTSLSVGAMTYKAKPCRTDVVRSKSSRESPPLPRNSSGQVPSNHDSSHPPSNQDPLPAFGETVPTRPCWSRSFAIKGMERVYEPLHCLFAQL